MISSTTSSSMSVKPRGLEIPGTDVGIVAFAAGRTVGAEAENVDFAV
jgi:hypothetical protein